MRDLSEIRKDIDKIDSQLLELFKARMDCAKEVGRYKKANDIPILNQQREDEILDEVEKKGGEYGAYARLMYTNLMELSRALQYNIVGGGEELRNLIANARPGIEADGARVAYQGIEGANSFEAASLLFPTSELVCRKTFAEVFAAVESGEADYGVLPVENSTAGSVSAVYDLILEHRFFIVGALDMEINHCLAGLRQSELSDIEIVWSHPQALAQCAEYITSRGYKSVPCENTAVAARDVAHEKRLNVAAICSKSAAKAYGLKLFEENIQDENGNTTRFIVISKTLCISENANKISLCFSLPHVTGSLYNLLARFSSLGLNLTKIESRPRSGREFDYLFYLDFSGNVHSASVVDLLSRLSEEMPEFSFLGNYFETDTQ